MHHGPAAKLEADKAAKQKAKVGVYLFLFYSLVYAGFVAIGLFEPDMLEKHVIGRTNLAVAYGVGLILMAIFLGFVYNIICTRLERKYNTK